MAKNSSQLAHELYDFGKQEVILPLLLCPTVGKLMWRFWDMQYNYCGNWLVKDQPSGCVGLQDCDYPFIDLLAYSQLEQKLFL